MKQVLVHITHICTIIVMFSMMIACSHPQSEEMYVNDRQVDVYGRYVFDVNLSTPLCSYNLDVGAYLSCDDPEFTTFQQLPLHILWQSPTDSLYEEAVYLDRGDHIGGDFHTKQLFSTYREEMIPKERGIWKLKISVPDSSAFKPYLRGIALRLEQN